MINTNIDEHKAVSQGNPALPPQKIPNEAIIAGVTAFLLSQFQNAQDTAIEDQRDDDIKVLEELANLGNPTDSALLGLEEHGIELIKQKTNLQENQIQKVREDNTKKKPDPKVITTPTTPLTPSSPTNSKAAPEMRA
jgi:hypothetical protein